MPEHRDPRELERAADEIEAVTGVVAADFIHEDARLGRPSIEIVIDPEYSRVPPRVLRKLAEHDLGLHDVAPRGMPRHFVVVAV